jgi:hypothetical protein
LLDSTINTTGAKIAILEISLNTRDFSFVKVAYVRSRKSVVGIATGYRLYDRGVGESGFESGWVKNFLFTSSRPALGSTQPPIQWVPGVKRQEREADHSPPASAEVKKTWIHSSTPTYVFMA